MCMNVCMLLSISSIATASDTSVESENRDIAPSCWRKANCTSTPDVYLTAQEQNTVPRIFVLLTY